MVLESTPNANGACLRCGAPVNKKRYCSDKCAKLAHYDRHREKYAEDSKRWRLAHTEARMLSRARSRAKKTGVEFTLTPCDIPPIPEFCPVFPWLRLEERTERGARGQVYDNAPSLDRIDNTRGYVPGNVRIISYRANVLKSTATDLELYHLGRDANTRFVFRGTEKIPED